MNKLIPIKNSLKTIGLLMLAIVVSFSRNSYAQATMVGSLGGEMVVSPSGLASYSIPIEVVPGTHGMQPNLSITYNSGMGRGLLGLGWDLTGLSSINRTPRSHYYDGAIGYVNFDGNDRFTFDGQRLIRLSSGNYAATNAEYGTEIEDFTRVTLKGTPNDTSQYFIAVTGQGQIIEYGHMGQSKLILPQGGVFSWMVDKVTDADGNYMIVKYERDWNTGEIFPQKIKYTGNETTGLTPYARVEFQYRTDPNSNKAYIGGNTMTTAKLLEKIIVKYGSDTVRQYNLEYDTIRNTRLTAVTLQDANGNNLARTIIDWGNNNLSASCYTIGGIQDCGKQILDYNGDNVPDLLLTRYNSGVYQWEIKKGNGNGGYQSTTYYGNIGTTYPVVFAVDYNGDGRDGFGYVYQESNSADYIFKIRDMENGDLVEKFSRTLHSGQFLVGDFLGQGGAQFLFVGESSHQQSLVTNSINNTNFNIPSNSLLSVTDLNGNGKTDIQVVRDSYIDVYEYNELYGTFMKILDSHVLSCSPSKGFHGDFNGDGMIDYIFYTYANNIGQWYLKMSKGTGYKAAVTLPFNSTHLNNYPYPKFSLSISDINGDGKDDIIQPTYTTNGPLILNVYYMRGIGASDNLKYDTIQIHNHCIEDLYTVDYQFADFNHDGKNELFSAGYVFQNPVIINFPETREHDLVASVTNGYGKITSLEYQYCNSPSIGFLGTDGKRIHYPLVSKMRNPNGNGGIRETVFSYGEAIFDYERYCFLGFEYHKTYCDGTNTKLEFDHNETYRCLIPLHSLTYYRLSGGDELGGYIPDTAYWHQNNGIFYHYETVNTSGFHNLSYGRHVSFFPVSSTINRLENKVTTSNVWLNSEGRVYKSSVHHRKAKTENGVIPWISRDSTRYTYTTVTLPNGKTVKKPSEVKTWNIRNGYNQTPWRRNRYTYSSGRVVRDSVVDCNGRIGVTVFTYNGYGLADTETYTPNGMTAMVKTYGYDNKGRFLNQETSPIGHTRSALFNKYTGTMTTETDVNNLTTTYHYDDFGRPTQIIRPDQTVRNISYHWNDVSQFSRAVYYVKETEAGTPETKTFYDILGRVVHTYSEGQGYNDIVYDNRGRVEKQTCVPYDDPATASNSKTWQLFNYDDYDRITDERAPYTDISYSYYESGNASQHDFFVSAVDNIRETRQTKTYDVLGRLKCAEDEGGTINYSYAYETRSGKIQDKTTVSIGNANTVVVSDLRGNRLSIQDPDAGTVTSTYNALNQLVNRTDANGNQTVYNYDLAGRVTRVDYEKNTDSEVVRYTYDNASGKGVGKLASVEHEGDIECYYSYDTLGRLYNRQVVDGHNEYDHLYEYDTLGHLQYLTYPDGFRIKHTYNGLGELASIDDAADNSMIYSVKTRNAFRQPVKCLFGNETGTEYSYNTLGMLTGIKNGNYVEQEVVVHGVNVPVYFYTIGSQYRDLTYTYDDKGFIATRTDARTNQSETYYYDDLDRLDSYRVNGLMAAIFEYSATGNITSNTKVGDYSYSSIKPHAVRSIDGDERTGIPQTQCNVTYNLRNRPATLNENGYNIILDYDASGMRRHTTITNGQTLVKEKTRISELYELDVTPTTSRRLDYIYAEGRVVAVRVYVNGSGSLYYVLTDHLGSWEKVLDENKNTVQQTHFDPWGNRMSYTAWNTPQNQTSFTFDRGFTGHEHYDCMRIINANARLYDPVIGRFFSPDPYVQTPDFTQGFNRYSYCMNNPVMFSDPDGEFLGIPMLGLAFVAELTSNWLNGVDNAIQTAWNNAIATVNGMDQCAQFSVSLGENTYFNFGISPFSFGANAGISYNNGTSSFSIGGGYGVLSGPYGYFSGSQKIGDATISFGFGKGSNYYGWNMAYTYKGYGIGYGRTYYGNAIGLDEIPNPQITGTPSIYFKNGSFRLENDYFGDAHDRWRTNAWELTIGNFTLGSTIYTNNPEEMGYGTSNEPSPLWGYNRPDKHDPTKEYQAWNNGFVYDCPLWIGWIHGNSISRIGYRHPVFQDATQNFVHKYCNFGRMHYYIHYQHFEKDRLFYGGGYYNPFSLY